TAILLWLGKVTALTELTTLPHPLAASRLREKKWVQLSSHPTPAFGWEEDDYLLFPLTCFPSLVRPPSSHPNKRSLLPSHARYSIVGSLLRGQPKGHLHPLHHFPEKKSIQLAKA
ncbi:unnamed protein product, partial [Musa acuminata var. zebrina]